MPLVFANRLYVAGNAAKIWSCWHGKRSLNSNDCSSQPMGTTATAPWMTHDVTPLLHRSREEKFLRKTPENSPFLLPVVLDHAKKGKCFKLTIVSWYYVSMESLFDPVKVFWASLSESGPGIGLHCCKSLGSTNSCPRKKSATFGSKMRLYAWGMQI